VTAPVFFNGKAVRTAILERESMPTGRSFRGPAVVTEYSATTVIPPAKAFHLDRTGNLVINLRAAKK
jgi:N-methylhydantoinase A